MINPIDQKAHRTAPSVREEVDQKMRIDAIDPGIGFAHASK